MTAVPVEARAAATVVLVRASPRGPEVLLTQRPASMAFAPDMYVFPGGRVDATDAEPALLTRSVVAPADAARALGGDFEPAPALATYIAAIRELFEEAGILLADVADAGTASAGTASAGTAAAGDDGRPVPPRSLSAARSALVGGDATLPAIAAELGLRLRTDLLVPLSRWVTPPTLPRRFDARFFAAELPSGTRVSFEGNEVAGHRWMTPRAGLLAMAAGEIGMWLPTSATLQQLEHATSVGQMRDRLTPGILGEIQVRELTPEVTRIVMPAGGGVAGQPVCAYLVGRRRHVLIDPGDPTGPSLDQARELVALRGGSIEAIALTQVDPDHGGGTEALAEVLGIPVFTGPGGGGPLPYAVHELADLELLGGCDVPLRAIHAPGPRPDHLAFIVGTGDTSSIMTGDLDGRRGLRTILPPIDAGLATASRDRLHVLAPGAVWLPGHPA